VDRIASRHSPARLAALFLLAALPAAAQQAAGSWAPAGSLAVGRYAPAAVLLPDGRVIVAGGYSFEQSRTHATSELFDPSTSAWVEGPRMRFDRNFALPIPLAGGDLLLVAGFRNRIGTTATTERLHSARLRFAPDAEAGAPPAVEERELFSVTPMADGRYLIAGGYSTLRRRTLDTAEIFDPRTERFTPLAPRLVHARFGHAGVLLPDGRVLLVGGKVLATNDDVREAEVFDSQRGAFLPAGLLRAGRDRCTAWLLPGEPLRVLVAGGSAKEGGTLPARRCEFYDPAAARFSDGPEMMCDRMAHTGTPLPDGRVLLVGGWSTSESRTTPRAEVWDPAAARFLPAGSLLHGRHDHAAVLLRDGRVLVAGGKEAPARDGVETPLPAEVWKP
jgi:hypothetical protein